MKSKVCLGYFLLCLVYQVSINEIHGADIHDSNLEDRLMNLESAVGQLKKKEQELKEKVDTLEEKIKLLEMQDSEKVSQIQRLEEKVKTWNKTEEFFFGQDVLLTCHELLRMGETVDREDVDQDGNNKEYLPLQVQCSFYQGVDSSADDEVQTNFIQKNLNILWQTSKSRQPFSFNDMDDCLKAKYSGCEAANDCCENLTIEINIMKTDIINLMGVVGNNAQNITELTSKVFDNAHLINDNANSIVTNKNNIDTNTNNINNNKNDINGNTNIIDTNSYDIDTNKDNIDTNNHNININIHDIETNMETIETLTNLHISSCGYRYHMTTTGQITYKNLVTDVNNLNRGGLDIETGVFTAPIQGTYLINIHFHTQSPGHFSIYPYINGERLTEFGIVSDSYNSQSNVWDSAGRSFTTELNQNDNLHVAITAMYPDGSIIAATTFCTSLLK